ncbi:alpha/beta hydrolase family protein [Streptomyces formicae]|uniref:Lipase (Secreted protein) n=1 Tax=Streptomyces formicae TaxID=1616117 RepID=A0A291Q5R1_9ACTN|nr:alpha/beta hydrolase [Streptomyces formicae]ATL26825.1 lipase (secreted protein) [Streptomyces formicae]
MSETRKTPHGRALVPLLTLALTLPLADGGASLAATPHGAAGGGATSSAATARAELPRPTGPFAVGRDTLHLVDESRRDPWVSSAGARELMVSAYYPALPGLPALPGSGRPARYMTEKEAQLLLKSGHMAGKVSAAAYSGARAFARTDARPLQGRFPLVLLSPGFTTPRATLTHLAEDLASRGYVVATVDHAYEAAGAAFPGGRTLTCAACRTLAEPGALRTVTTGRAKDLSYVIDRLTGPEATWRYSRLIDPARIGAGGHSVGGAAALAVMTTDRRVRAGLNMDGTFYTPPTGLAGRPFLMLGTRDEHSAGGRDVSWDRTWRGLDGWKRWLTVKGSGHFTFTDAPVLLDQLGAALPGAPLSGERSQRLTRAYVGAFFDQELRGIPRPLLDGPDPAAPEVAFERP